MEGSIRSCLRELASMDIPKSYRETSTFETVSKTRLWLGRDRLRSAIMRSDYSFRIVQSKVEDELLLVLDLPTDIDIEYGFVHFVTDLTIDGIYDLLNLLEDILAYGESEPDKNKAKIIRQLFMLTAHRAEEYSERFDESILIEPDQD